MNSRPLILTGGILLFLITIQLATAALLNPNDISNGCSGSKNYLQCYQEMTDAYYVSGNVTKITSNRLTVPWYSSGSSCLTSDLKAGSNCGLATVNSTQFCQVTDEFSIVCRAVAYSNNNTRMDQCYNAVLAMSGTYGQLPGWVQSVNLNTNTITTTSGDSASDASARIAIALWAASNNSNFNATSRANYRALAINISRDIYQYEIKKGTCYNTTIGPQVCLLSATGGNSAGGSITNYGFFYTGYAQDNALAMLMAYGGTGNTTYLAAAQNITLQYLASANYTGATFKATPGVKFHYSTSANNTLIAHAEDGLPAWDTVDAPRIFGLGLLQYYYNNVSNTPNTYLNNYMSNWSRTYLQLNNNSVYIQYTPTGASYGSSQSGYWAQGLQANALAGPTQYAYETVLRNAIGHYNPSTRTMDGAACYGAYYPAPTLYAMASTMGIDAGLFSNATGSGSSGGSGGSTSNANISITLNTPLNASTNTNNNISLNVTVLNFNTLNTSSCTGNQTYHLIYSSPNATNWTGGTINTTRQSYELGGSGYLLSPDLDLATMSYIELYFEANFTPATEYVKVYGWVDNTVNLDPHALGQNSSSQEWKPEPGYTPSLTRTFNNWHNYTIYWDNRTTGSHRLSIDGSIVYTVSGAIPRVYDQFRIAQTNGRGEIKNISIYGYYNRTSCTNTYNAANATITFSWSNGTLIGTRTGITNTSTNWSLPNMPDGTYNWQARAQTANSDLTLSNLQFIVNTSAIITDEPTVSITYITSNGLTITPWSNAYENRAVNHTIDTGTTYVNQSLLNTTASFHTLHTSIQNYYPVDDVTYTGINGQYNITLAGLANTNLTSTLSSLSCTVNTTSGSYTTGLVWLPPGSTLFQCAAGPSYDAFNQTVTRAANSTQTITLTTNTTYVTIDFDANTTGSIVDSSVPGFTLTDFANSAYYDPATFTLRIPTNEIARGVVTVTFNGNYSNQTKFQAYMWYNDGTSINENMTVYPTWSPLDDITNSDKFAYLKIKSLGGELLSGATIQVYKATGTTRTLVDQFYTESNGQALLWAKSNDMMTIIITKDNYDILVDSTFRVSEYQSAIREYLLSPTWYLDDEAIWYMPEYISNEGATVFLWDKNNNRYDVSTNNGYTTSIQTSSTVETAIITVGNAGAAWCAASQDCLINYSINGVLTIQSTLDWKTISDNTTTVAAQITDNPELNTGFNKKLLVLIGIIILAVMASVVSFLIKHPASGSITYVLGIMILGFITGYTWTLTLASLVIVIQYALRFLYGMDEQN